MDHQFPEAARAAVYQAIFSRRDVRGQFLPTPVPDEVLEYMDRVRAVSPVPVCAGFGIRAREHVARRLSTNQGDLVYSAFCPGCVCHIDGRVPGSTSKSQWQQGIAVVEYTDTEENIIPIGISDGRMMYNGKLWQARERENEVNEMLMRSLELVTA